MRFKLDEHPPAEIADDLRLAGHDATTVVEQGLTGIDDEALMRVVQAEARVMLTMDKGIANVMAYPPPSFAGIVFFARIKQDAVQSCNSYASTWQRYRSMSLPAR